MTDKKLKTYAVTLTVKLKPDGVCKYKSKTFRGISFAKNQSIAKEQCVQQFMQDGQLPAQRVIMRDEIFIKECTLFDDFINKTKSNNS